MAPRFFLYLLIAMAAPGLITCGDVILRLVRPGPGCTMWDLALVLLVPWLFPPSLALFVYARGRQLIFCWWERALAVLVGSLCLGGPAAIFLLTR
jgi:hypothetical protein